MFVHRCIGHHMPEGYEELVLVKWTFRGIKWEPHARPEVALILHQGHAVESPQYHVVVVAVSGVLEGHILEQTAVLLHDVIHPGPHLLAATDRAPRPSIPRPREITREEGNFIFILTKSNSSWVQYVYSNLDQSILQSKT